MKCEKAKMTAADIIIQQLLSLKNDKNGSGIKVAYELASPANKDNTGPLNRFKEMLKTQYSHLLNFDSWEFIGKAKINDKATKYSQDVLITKANKSYIYRFNLSKQYDYQNNRPIIDPYNKMCLNKYWRTDSVMLKNKGLENFRGGNKSQKNVFNNDLEVCSRNPMTGFYRDGYCNTGPNDFGTHTVCSKVTNDFLIFSRRTGNDLISPSPANNFPGLKDGDYWCLCANRYKDAIDNNIKMNVNKKASHRNTLDYLDLNQL